MLDLILLLIAFALYGLMLWAWRWCDRHPESE